MLWSHLTGKSGCIFDLYNYSRDWWQLIQKGNSSFPIWNNFHLLIDISPKRGDMSILHLTRAAPGASVLPLLFSGTRCLSGVCCPAAWAKGMKSYTQNHGLCWNLAWWRPQTELASGFCLNPAAPMLNSLLTFSICSIAVRQQYGSYLAANLTPVNSHGW